VEESLPKDHRHPYPGRCLPSNQQPCICPDLSLGAWLSTSLSPQTLITTPLSIVGTGGHMPSCIGSMVVTMSWGSSECVKRSGVTSCNSHVTLLTNLGQFWVPSHLSQPHHTISSSISELIKSQTCLVMYFQHPFIQIPVVLLFYVSVPVPNYCPLLSHYCFLSRLLYYNRTFVQTPRSEVLLNNFANTIIWTKTVMGQ